MRSTKSFQLVSRQLSTVFPRPGGKNTISFYTGAHVQHRSILRTCSTAKRKKPGYLMRLAAPSSSTKCSFGSRNSIRMGQSDLAETQKKTPREEFPGRRGAWKIASALCDFFRERRSHLRFLSSQILNALMRYRQKSGKKNISFSRSFELWTVSRWQILYATVTLGVVCCCQAAWKTMRCDACHKISRRLAQRNMFKRQ